MKELNDILLAYEQATLAGRRTALVTVVDVKGSSYRRPGARMLVTETGETTGAVSGGCLEGDALRKAQMAIARQENKLEIYDTTHDDEHRIGIQLGCNGIVYLLFEPLNPDDPNNPVRLLQQATADRVDSVVVTVISPDKKAGQPGTCHVVVENGGTFGPDEALLKQAAHHLQLKKPAVVESDDHTVLYQYLPPAQRLLIVGGGNDAQPLVATAALLGWSVTVADGRPAHATPRRFPGAERVVVAKPDALLREVGVDERTAVVLLTHNYNYDLAALEQLLPTACPYIGVLGPKKKLHRMLEELEKKGMTVGEEALQRIYGPVGLDIGAETAEEIALSVVAEIKAVFACRQGRFLKDRAAEIHLRQP